MQTDSSIEDYTYRVAERWGAGKRGRNNGVVLFVFVNDRRLFMQVGYGLEGALPDALARRIIDREIKPRFRAGDYDGGLVAGVDAIIAATKGEYRADRRSNSLGGGRVGSVMFILFFVIVVVMIIAARYGGPAEYTRRGRRRRRSGGWVGPIIIPTGG